MSKQSIFLQHLTSVKLFSLIKLAYNIPLNKQLVKQQSLLKPYQLKPTKYMEAQRNLF